MKKAEDDAGTKLAASASDADKTPTSMPWVECPECHGGFEIVFAEGEYRLPWHFRPVMTVVGPIFGETWCPAGMRTLGRLVR